MSDKYHIKPNGTVAKCTATKRPCPYGGDENHFSTKEAANEAFQKRMENEQEKTGPTGVFVIEKEIEAAKSAKQVFDLLKKNGFKVQKDKTQEMFEHTSVPKSKALYVFLDDVTRVRYDSQYKVYTVDQMKKVKTVGSGKPIRSVSNANSMFTMYDLKYEPVKTNSIHNKK
jgi:hypothetical protein